MPAPTKSKSAKPPHSSNAARATSRKKVDRQFVTALARGLAVMRCFDALHPELGTSEIAAMVKLPQPTAWRLCYTLQELGYLVQSPGTEKLRVGMGVLGLGQSSIASIDIGQLVLPELMQIAKATGAAVTLGVIDQGEVLIVQRAQGDGPLLVNLSIGSRLPVATSAAGWAYLAALPKKAQADLLQELRYQYSGRWSDLRTAIEAAESSYKTAGFVLNDGFYHPGVKAVGAPAFDKQGRCVYVVTCGGPSLKPKNLRDEVGPRIAALGQKMTAALAGRSSNS